MTYSLDRNGEFVESHLNNGVMYEKSNLQVQRWKKNSLLTSWLGQDELANKISASETKGTVSFIAYKPGYSRILQRCPFLS